MIAEHSRNGQVTIVAQPSTLTRAFIGKEAWVEKIIDHDHRPRRGEKRTGQHAGLAGMRRMARQLQEGSFDRIILFSGRSSRGLIAWLSDIPTRMGFGYRRLQRLFLNQGPYIPAHKGPSVAAFHEASAFMVAHGSLPSPCRASHRAACRAGGADPNPAWQGCHARCTRSPLAPVKPTNNGARPTLPNSHVASSNARPAAYCCWGDLPKPSWRKTLPPCCQGPLGPDWPSSRTRRHLAVQQLCAWPTPALGTTPA